MAWLQLRVYSAHPEFAEEILLAHGAQAVCQSDAADTPLLEPLPGETPLWPQTVTTGLFPDSADLRPAQQGLRDLLPDGARARLESELLEDRDWVRAWLDNWQPLKFGRRLWVTPAEKAGQIADPGAIVMKLDPGLAFGTGTHPTTALCLEWLDSQPLQGRSVLDYGCGSGILAIGALLLGARSAIGVDLDPQALLAARQNAASNGVGERLSVCPPESLVLDPADVVLANILANPLISLAPRLAQLTRSGGRIALAGLTRSQAPDVRAAYAPWFTLDDDMEKDGWTRVSGTRHGAM
jgi:ribosomal protein L11 methyltransferase